MRRFVPPPELLDSPLGREFDAPQAARCWPRSDPAPTRARVVIVGGGLAAISLAGHLWHATGLSDVVILDPGEVPGSRFLGRTRRLRQPVLRSPYEHHVGAQESRDCELLDFARAHWRYLTGRERDQVRMAMSGQRAVVPWDVFAAHLTHVCVNHGIPARTWRSHVEEVAPAAGGGWHVRHRHGEVWADAVVFAIGERSHSVPAGWDGDPRVVRWDAEWATPAGDQLTAVIGSGLTAAHVISEVCGAGGRVLWVQRGSERFQCSDVNARFFRPEGRSVFLSRGLTGRLAILRRERRPSIMFEFRPLLAGWEARGALSVRRHAAPVGIDEVGGGLRLRLGDGTQLPAVDRVVCAFGTEPEPLPLASGYEQCDGFPVLADSSLELIGHPGVHVTGALAALSVGPAARNIDGMRVAAGRITRALTGAAPARQR